MTLFTDATGRKVVSIDTALTVGKVADYVVDPATLSVVALVLKKTAGAEEFLPWSNLAAFGEDAVTVASDAAIVVADEHVAQLAEKAHAMRGKRVLSSEGRELGAVKDVEFDPTNGALIRLLLKDDEIEAARLVASGSYAVIVRA